MEDGRGTREEGRRRSENNCQASASGSTVDMGAISLGRRAGGPGGWGAFLSWASARAVSAKASPSGRKEHLSPDLERH